MHFHHTCYIAIALYLHLANAGPLAGSPADLRASGQIATDPEPLGTSGPVLQPSDVPIDKVSASCPIAAGKPNMQKRIDVNDRIRFAVITEGLVNLAISQLQNVTALVEKYDDRISGLEEQVDEYEESAEVGIHTLTRTEGKPCVFCSVKHTTLIMIC